jgi:hypothetical protein
MLHMRHNFVLELNTQFLNSPSHESQDRGILEFTAVVIRYADETHLS